MTLKSICTDALNEIAGFEVPATFIANVNITAKACLNLVQREGRRLAHKYDWNELVAEHTFTTVADQATYDLPDDFRKFANMSHWDRANNWPLRGPTTPAQWQFLNSSITGESATITRWFMVRGTQYTLYPTPAATGDTIAFDYYSKNWIDLEDGSGNASTFANDNDAVLLDEDLLTAGLKWRFLQARGFPFEAEYREYEDLLESLLGSNIGAGTLRMDENFASGITQIPETGFGVS